MKSPYAGVFTAERFLERAGGETEVSHLHGSDRRKRAARCLRCVWWALGQYTFASHVNGTLLLNYIAASGSTQKSLGLTLTRVINGKPQYQDNFVTLANRAGFQTWWFSNQGQIGEYDTAIASIAKRADEVQFLKNGDFEADKNTHDETLLKMTAQVLPLRAALTRS